MITAEISRSPRTARAARRVATPAAAPDAAATWTITARLCAAREEADGSIQLVVADPTGRPHRLIVRFPDPESGPDDPCLQLRAVAARRTFIRELVQPPFEGFALLYGAARLTLTRSERRRAAPDVVDFTLLG